MMYDDIKNMMGSDSKFTECYLGTEEKTSGVWPLFDGRKTLICGKRQCGKTELLNYIVNTAYININVCPISFGMLKNDANATVKNHFIYQEFPKVVKRINELTEQGKKMLLLFDDDCVIKFYQSQLFHQLFHYKNLTIICVCQDISTISTRVRSRLDQILFGNLSDTQNVYQVAKLDIPYNLFKLSINALNPYEFMVYDVIKSDFLLLSYDREHQPDKLDFSELQECIFDPSLVSDQNRINYTAVRRYLSETHGTNLGHNKLLKYEFTAGVIGTNKSITYQIGIKKDSRDGYLEGMKLGIKLSTYKNVKPSSLIKRIEMEINGKKITSYYDSMLDILERKTDNQQILINIFSLTKKMRTRYMIDIDFRVNITFGEMGDMIESCELFGEYKDEEGMINGTGMEEILWPTIQYTGKDQVISNSHEIKINMSGFMRKLYWFAYISNDNYTRSTDETYLFNGGNMMLDNVKIMINDEEIVPWTPALYFHEKDNCYSYDFGEEGGVNVGACEMTLHITLKSDVMISKGNVIIEAHGLFNNLMLMGDGKMSLVDI